MVLFYKGKEGDETQSKFLYAGKLLYKQHSKELGLSLWPPKKGEEPWTCVFFLDELMPVYIPISVITELSKEYHFSMVQGFMPINDEAKTNLLTKYGSIDDFVRKFKIDDLSQETTELEERKQDIAHREAQMLLLKMGEFLGFDTYCPDKSQEAYGEKLSNYITLNDLPRSFIGDKIYPLVSKIDVIWFSKDVPEYAFEVEETTGVGSGLNRLSQLTPIAKKLFIIAPAKEYQKYEKFMNGRNFDNERDKFAFRDYGQLERYFSSVSKFVKLKNSFLEE